MTELKSPRLLYAKGLLFLLLGTIAGGSLILQNPTFRTAVLLALCIWSFARAYYFAFYVIEHYIDPTYRFAGLSSVVRYLIARGRSPSATPLGRTAPPRRSE
jgi:uncharacterized RDD family membrane protein YckC